MNEEPEVVETDSVTELEAYEEPGRDLKGADSEEKLAKIIQDHIVNDFETALNLVRSYQTLLKRALVPDLHFDEAHALLAKYRMESVDPIHVVHDPHFGDISIHTTSLPGTAEEVVDAQIEPSTDISETVNVAIDWGRRDESSEGMEFADPEWTPQPSGVKRDVNFDSGNELDKWLKPDSGQIEAPEPSEEFKRFDETNSDAVDEQIKENGDEIAEGLFEASVAKLDDEGFFEECVICEGTGKALKGVLKGHTCSRCGGAGVSKRPETFKLVGDEHGNFGIQPTGGNPDDE